MHELSIAQSIIDIVNRYAAQRCVEKVVRVGVRIGGFSCIEESSLIFCFDAVKKGSVASEAILEIEKEPARGECMGCGEVFELKGLILKCPVCGGRDVKVDAGEYIEVVYMEI